MREKHRGEESSAGKSDVTTDDGCLEHLPLTIRLGQASLSSDETEMLLLAGHLLLNQRTGFSRSLGRVLRRNGHGGGHLIVLVEVEVEELDAGCAAARRPHGLRVDPDDLALVARLVCLERPRVAKQFHLTVLKSVKVSNQLHEE